MSSIDLTYANAISGLKTSKALMDVATSNIANAENENYSKRVANVETQIVGDKVSGTTIASITRNIDTNLVNLLQNESSVKAYLETIANYNDHISIKLGQPSYIGNEQSNIASSIQAFFSSLKTLAVTPAGIAQKGNVISQAVLLSENISSTALGLHNVRYQADQAVYNSVQNINHLLSNLYDNNKQITLAANGGMDTANFLEVRDNLLAQLAQEIEINVYFQPTGTAIVSTVKGTPLVGQTSSYQLDYEPAASVNSFIDDGILAPIKVYMIDSQGNKSTYYQLVSQGRGENAGANSSITTDLKYGNLKALLDLRDTKIPLILDELDNLALNITDSMNALHNKGSGFPALQNVTGSRLVQATDLILTYSH